MRNVAKNVMRAKPRAQPTTIPAVTLTCTEPDSGLNVAELVGPGDTGKGVEEVSVREEAEEAEAEEIETCIEVIVVEEVDFKETVVKEADFKETVVELSLR
jgi:hypothetical protein